MFAVRRTLRAPLPRPFPSTAPIVCRPSSTASLSGDRPSPTAKRKIKSRILHKPRPLPGGAGVCAAYCAESSIRVNAISNYLESRSDPTFTTGSVSVHSPDVAHATLTVHEGTVTHTAHTFFFSSGAVVFWGVPLPVRRALLRDLADLAEHDVEADHSFSRAHAHAQRFAVRAARRAYPRDVLSLEDFDHEFSYRVQRGVTPQFRNDVIQLPTFHVLPLLAVSHGLAQSVKLAVHEQAIDVLVMRTRSLPEELALTGRTGMSQRDIKRFIGELIAARYSVSLVSDILDTPEFFWQNPELEGLYLECTSAVELRQRAAILETRVQVIKDSLDMLNNELSNSSSNRVERAILALIAVEVCIELARLFPTMV